MRIPKFNRAFALALLIGLMGLVKLSFGQHGTHARTHEMQHGFVLASDDQFASHLVATGHHSRQVEITGQLTIENLHELKTYQEQKKLNEGKSYFLFQAQSLDLPTLKESDVLTGHIVESRLGQYDPKNIIVKRATYKVERILLNIENPFFGD